MVPKMWDKPLWANVWTYLDPLDRVRLRTASTHWNVPGKYLAAWQALLLLFKVLSELVEFGPCISAETVKAHRSDSDPSPDLGDMWR